MVGAAEMDAKWTSGVAPTTEWERKKILGRVLDIATRQVYKSNVYTFAGETRVQQSGSPIGLDLSGEMGRLTMGDWDAKMARKLENNMVEVEMFKRYVDDVDIIMEAIPYGYRWVPISEHDPDSHCYISGRLEYDEKWEKEDEKIPLDLHTTNVMVAMANSIQKELQFEGDCGSNHEDGYIPVLDLKMKTVLLTEPGIDGTLVSYYQTIFKFFKKPMARKTIMNAKTAMSEKVKRETTANELLRRLLNTLPFMPESEENAVEAVNNYMVEMANSGYDEKWREDTLLNTIRGYKRKLRNCGKVEAPGKITFHENSTENLYRKQEEGERERYLARITEEAQKLWQG